MSQISVSFHSFPFLQIIQRRTGSYYLAAKLQSLKKSSRIGQSLL